MNCRILVFAFISILVFASCKKLTDERVVAIKTNSIIVNGTTIKASGTIVDLGETGIAEYGFCWADSANISINSNKILFRNASQTGDFENILLNLIPHHQYFVKTYAIVNNEVVYGNIQNFIAPDSGFNINTGQSQIVSVSSVKIQGAILNVGSLQIQSYGVCWSRTNEPVITNAKIDLGYTAHDTSFLTEIKPLALKTPYYAWVYAKLNDNTILYGNTITFSIPDLEVETDTFTIALQNIATLKGQITNLGIPAVTDHGFCWATNTSNPNFNNNKISLGDTNTTGLFYANLNALISGKTYYFRAYATDGSTIRYGRIIHFTF
jgi:hypothetical protein